MQYKDKFGMFNSLLLYFLEDAYYDDRGDIDTIKRFVLETIDRGLKQTISQGKEILDLQPFPAEWICSSSGDRLPASGIDTPEEYKNWVEWVVRALEEEARKAGKYNEW